MLKNIISRIKINNWFFCTILLLIFVSQISLNGQCEGPKNNPFSLIINTATNNVQSFSVKGLTIQVRFNSANNCIEIEGPAGMGFLTNGMGEALNVGMNTDISSMTPFTLGAVKLYTILNPAIPTGAGPFGAGTGGYVGFQYMGNFGWIEFTQCGATTAATCFDYRFSVTDAFFDQANAGSNVTGVCPLVVAIPTLSQWGIVSLALLLLIFAIVELKRNFISLDQIKGNH